MTAESATGTVPGATVARRHGVGHAWAAFDAAPGHRRAAGTGAAALLALALGLAVAVVALTTGPAPAGEGTAAGWLPAPRLLLAPLAAVSGTGTAVAVLGVLCLVVAATALYRITGRLALGRGGRLAAVLVLVLTPTTLYQQTTTTTGPVLMAALLATVAGLARWAVVKRTPSGGELAIFAGLPCAVAVLTRYEGWVLLAAGMAFVALVARGKERGARWAVRMALSFAAVPVAGMLWWLAATYAAHGSPFAGADGVAGALGLPSVVTAEAPTRGLLRSVTEALPADVTAALAVGVALLGCAAAAVRFRWSERLWVVGLLARVAVVDVSVVAGSLAAGDDHGWVGRFALPVIPALALVSGLAVDLLRRAGRTRGATVALPAAFVVSLLAAGAAAAGHPVGGVGSAAPSLTTTASERTGTP